MGNKLAGKSRDKVLEAVLSLFGEENISAVQQSVDVLRITFKTEALALNALQNRGVRLFGLWCRMDGGPAVTIIHLFDFPFEGLVMMRSKSSSENMVRYVMLGISDIFAILMSLQALA